MEHADSSQISIPFISARPSSRSRGVSRDSDPFEISGGNLHFLSDDFLSPVRETSTGAPLSRRTFPTTEPSPQKFRFIRRNYRYHSTATPGRHFPRASPPTHSVPRRGILRLTLVYCFGLTPVIAASTSRGRSRLARAFPRKLLPFCAHNRLCWEFVCRFGDALTSMFGF